MVTISARCGGDGNQLVSMRRVALALSSALWIVLVNVYELGVDLGMRLLTY